MKISEAYLKYYQKSSLCLYKKYKLVNDRWIDLKARCSRACRQLCCMTIFAGDR